MSTNDAGGAGAGVSFVGLLGNLPSPLLPRHHHHRQDRGARAPAVPTQGKRSLVAEALAAAHAEAEGAEPNADTGDAGGAGGAGGASSQLAPSPAPTAAPSQQQQQTQPPPQQQTHQTHHQTHQPHQQRQVVADVCDWQQLVIADDADAPSVRFDHRAVVWERMSTMLVYGGRFSIWTRDLWALNLTGR